MEEQCRMLIRGSGWVNVFYPAGTSPILSLPSDLQWKVVKVVFMSTSE